MNYKLINRIAKDFVDDVNSGVDWQQTLNDILYHDLFPKELNSHPNRVDERDDFARQILSRAEELVDEQEGSAFYWLE